MLFDFESEVESLVGDAYQLRKIVIDKTDPCR